MPVTPPRTARLVLVTTDGRVLGSLPPVTVETPWWQDVAPVVRAARGAFGIDVAILRLLETERPIPHGGDVTYLAEVASDGSVDPASGPLTPWTREMLADPNRMSWARPGGPAADLAWAAAVLERREAPRSGQAEQLRTWNLSSLWRLPTTAGAAWLKVVPPFFAHEGALLERLDGQAVPRLLGRDGARMLLAEVPGEDRYDAPLDELVEMVRGVVALQRRFVDRVAELRDIGLPDWRGPALTGSLRTLVDRCAGLVGPGDGAVLRAFAADLPARFATIAECGLPDTLVHGDFHPGNVRGVAGRLVLLDWGDSGVGHPLLDQPAFLDRIRRRDRVPVRNAWHGAWQGAIPGSDPGRAATLLGPVAAARQALIYQRFLDGIEPSEHVYHRADVPDWLRRAATLVRAERTAGRR